MNTIPSVEIQVENMGETSKQLCVDAPNCSTVNKINFESNICDRGDGHDYDHDGIDESHICNHRDNDDTPNAADFDEDCQDSQVLPTQNQDNHNNITGKSLSANAIAPTLRVEELKDTGSDTVDTGSSRDCSDCEHGGNRPITVEEEMIIPSNELKEKILAQVEFYFSDVNIIKDAFLLKHVKRNKQGFVSLKLITSFKRMKALTKDYRVVAYCVDFSDKLECNEDKKKIRRKDPLPAYDESVLCRTVVAANLPTSNPSIEDVAELFKKCGEISLIRIIRPSKSIPPDVRKHIAKHPELSSQVCAVIEFDAYQHARNAVQLVHEGDDWRKGLRVSLLVNESKKKLNGDEECGKRMQKKSQSKNQNRIKELAGGDATAYSSGSDNEQCSKRPQNLSCLKPDGNKLSPSTTPRESPKNSPKSSPRSSPNRVRKHGRSPLATEISPGSSPRVTPHGSPESRRKNSGTSPRSSPWVRRRMKAAQEASKLTGQPVIVKKSNAVAVVRQPFGPDGTKGFNQDSAEEDAKTEEEVLP